MDNYVCDCHMYCCYVYTLSCHSLWYIQQLLLTYGKVTDSEATFTPLTYFAFDAVWTIAKALNNSFHRWNPACSSNQSEFELSASEDQLVTTDCNDNHTRECYLCISLHNTTIDGITVSCKTCIIAIIDSGIENFIRRAKFHLTIMEIEFIMFLDSTKSEEVL